MTQRLSFVLAALFAASMTHTASAQTSRDSGDFSVMQWRLVGPHRGGRVLAVSGIPGDPSTFYFGAVGGGVWKSVNAGLTWEPLFDDQHIASIGALAIAPSDPKVIYVGTGEADMRSDITFGDGVYKSTDGGAHWQHLGLEDTRQIGKVLVNPRDPNEVWVAALGHAYGPNADRGVFRSRDGGRSWEKVLYRGPDVGAIDLAFDPADPLVHRNSNTLVLGNGGAHVRSNLSIEQADHTGPHSGHRVRRSLVVGARSHLCNAGRARGREQ